MIGQGCSKLSADIDGRILDRIAGLEKIIASELAEGALAANNTKTRRDCTLSNEVMIWVVLAMGLFTELSICQVVKACRRLRHGEKLPARSNLCVADNVLDVPDCEAHQSLGHWSGNLGHRSPRTHG